MKSVIGFDDEGSQFDSDGNLRDLVDRRGSRKIQGQTDKLVAEYNRFEPVPASVVNGELTLGENIADTLELRLPTRPNLVVKWSAPPSSMA